MASNAWRKVIIMARIKGGRFAFCLISFPGRGEYGVEELKVYDYIGCICDAMFYTRAIVNADESRQLIIVILFLL